MASFRRWQGGHSRLCILQHTYHIYHSIWKLPYQPAKTLQCFNLFFSTWLGTKNWPQLWFLRTFHTYQPFKFTYSSGYLQQPTSPQSPVPPHHQHWDMIPPRMPYHHFARANARPTWDGGWLKTDSQQVPRSLIEVVMKTVSLPSYMVSKGSGFLHHWWSPLILEKRTNPSGCFGGKQIVTHIQNLTYLNFCPAHCINIQVEFTKSFFFCVMRI